MEDPYKNYAKHLKRIKENISTNGKSLVSELEENLNFQKACCDTLEIVADLKKNAVILVEKIINYIHSSADEHNKNQKIVVEASLKILLEKMKLSEKNQVNLEGVQTIQGNKAKKNLVATQFSYYENAKQDISNTELTEGKIIALQDIFSKAYINNVPKKTEEYSDQPNLAEASYNNVLGNFNVNQQFHPHYNMPNAQPKKLAKTWNFPSPEANPNFTGRVELLENLNSILKISLFQSAPIIVTSCYGMGGVGKTQLAIEFAYKNNMNYTHMLWFHADNKESLIKDYLKLADYLGIAEDSLEKTIENIKFFLQKNNTINLLIYDNAQNYETLKDYLPSMNNNILVTSRYKKWAQKSIEIGLFTIEECREYIKKILGNRGIDVIEDIDNLAEKLGHLPLALAQACGYLTQKREISIKKYLKEYEEQEKKFLSEDTMPAGESKSHIPVYVTFKMAEIEIRNKSNLAGEFLRLCAFVHYLDIPDFLFKEFSKLSINFKKEDAYEALTVLNNYCLLERDLKNKSSSVHILLQRVVISSLPINQKVSYLENVINVFIKKYPFGEELDKLHDISIKKILFNHGDRLITEIDNLKEFISEEKWNEFESEILYYLLICLSDACYDLGYAEKKCGYLERVLIFEKTHYEPDSSKIAYTLNNLAIAYGDLNKNQEELEYLEKALNILEKKYSNDHPQIGITLANLGNVYLSLKRPKKGSDYLYRAYKILSECYYEQNNPHLGRTCALLGNSCDALEEHEKGESYLFKALNILEKYYGNEHPQVANVLSDIGGHYEKLNNVIKQLEYLHKASEIFKKNSHPSYGKTHEKIFFLEKKHDQKYYDNKKDYLWRNIAIRSSKSMNESRHISITMGYTVGFKNKPTIKVSSLKMNEPVKILEEKVLGQKNNNNNSQSQNHNLFVESNKNSNDNSNIANFNQCQPKIPIGISPYNRVKRNTLKNSMVVSDELIYIQTKGNSSMISNKSLLYKSTNNDNRQQNLQIMKFHFTDIVPVDESFHQLLKATKSEEVQKAIEIFANNPEKFGIVKNGLTHQLLCGTFLNKNESELLELINKHTTSSSVTIQDNFEMSFIDWCAALGYVKIIIKMKKHHLINLDELPKTKSGLNALHFAMFSGRFNVVDKLLRVNQYQLETVLFPIDDKEVYLNIWHLTILANQPEIVESIVLGANRKKTSVHVEIKNHEGNKVFNVFHLAIYSNALNVLSKLLSMEIIDGKSTNVLLAETKIFKGRECDVLSYAAALGRVNAVMIIMQYIYGTSAIEKMQSMSKWHVNSLIDIPQNALCTAIEFNQYDTVDFLLGAGIDPTQHKDYENMYQRLKTKKEDKAEIEEYENVVKIWYAVQEFKKTKKYTSKKLPVSKKQAYKTLTLAGGGGKGFAYVFALAKFEEQCQERAKKYEKESLSYQHIVRVAGTSVGSMFALALAVGILPSELNIFLEDDFTSFFEGSALKDLAEALENMEKNSKPFYEEPVVIKLIEEAGIKIEEFIKHSKQFHERKSSTLGTAWYLLSNGLSIKGIVFDLLKNIQETDKNFEGLSSGQAVYNWLKQLLEKQGLKEDLTFGELADLIKEQPLKYKHLYVSVTNLTTRKLEVFSSENPLSNYKDYCILDAVCASAALPFIFKPRQLRYKQNNEFKFTNEIYVDGGVLLNDLLDEFDTFTFSPEQSHGDNDFRETNKETVGFCFKANTPKIAQPKTVKDKILNLAKMYIGAENIINEHRNIDFGRKIYLDVEPELSTLDFRKLNIEKKESVKQKIEDNVKNHFLTKKEFQENYSSMYFKKYKDEMPFSEVVVDKNIDDLNNEKKL